MAMLILGLLIWVGAHGFKRLAPEARGAMGDRGKGLVAVLVLASVVLMVIGYRGADYIAIWSPPQAFVHVNNLMMVFAFYLYAASAAKGAKIWLGTKVRHPQLTAVAVWAVAHLLVNGDLASVVLFGGMLAWAVATMGAINRAEGPWVVPQRAAARKELVAVVVTVVVVVLVTGIHSWLGVRPFAG